MAYCVKAIVTLQVKDDLADAGVGHSVEQIKDAVKKSLWTRFVHSLADDTIVEFSDIEVVSSERDG